ncbi:MAG: hypothetical protein FVQ85_02900 [Planctomycetes bacterium]|nr:hypothetical protein [Planctomycetota bacterium]
MSISESGFPIALTSIPISRSRSETPYISAQTTHACTTTPSLIICLTPSCSFLSPAKILDEGRLSPASWTIWYDQERWWDQITARHGDGTNLSFADGRAEYWKWEDPRTIEVAEMEYNYWQSTGRQGPISTQPGNPDLHNVQKAVFGELGYTP